MGKLTPAQKQRLWGFHDDEIAIEQDATWEEVKKALDVVGNADQFERIRDEALRLYDVPESVVRTSPPENPEEVLKQIREARDIIRRVRREKDPDPERFAGIK
jgi:hypothetical protein